MTPISSADVAEYVRLSAGRGPYHFARAYRFMSDRHNYGIFDRPHYMPYLWDVYEALRTLSPGQRVVVMKCAQSGWTETAINLTLWFMATQHENVLYMLPTEGQLGDFAQARLTTMLALSPWIQAAFSSADNVGLKIAWGQSLYLRGANSKAKLREIPVGLLIRDEYDVMDREGREHCRSRLGASQRKWIYDLANPSFPETGIHREYLGGTREEFSIECPMCKTDTPPLWPDSADRKKGLVCPECNQRLRVEERWEAGKARWVAREPKAPFRSFSMSQLIAPTTVFSELFLAWEDAQFDNTKLQVFHNYTLGQPFSAAGAKLDETTIRKLHRHGAMVPSDNGPSVMGVDVKPGRLHTVLRRTDGGILWAGVVTWDELPRLMHAYNVQAAGVDIRPETTKSKEFARAFQGRVTLIAYNPNAGSTGQVVGDEDGVPKLTVGRTEAIDRMMARFFSLEESVPDNLSNEFWQHMRSVTRVITREETKPDTSKVPREFAVWREAGPDDFVHAMTYSEIVRRGGSPYYRSQIFPPGREEEQDVQRPQYLPGRQERLSLQGFRDPEGGW